MIKATEKINELRGLPFKKLPTSNMTRGVTIGTRLKCIDGTGSQLVEVIGVFHTGNTAKRNVSAGVGHIIKVAVKKGVNKGKMEMAVVTTTKRKFYRNSEGIRVMFEKNTCIIVEKTKKIYRPKSTVIKYPVAKECLERVPSLRKYVTVC